MGGSDPLPRITPVDPSALDGDTAGLLALTENADGVPLSVIATLARRPDLVAPFLTWSAALAAPGALDPRRHELVALRTAWRHGSDYEWGHHVEYAHRDGVSADEIVRVGGADLDDWAEPDRVLLALVDAVCAGEVDDGVWDAAAHVHDDTVLVELLWTVGQYASLSMITAAARVTPEPGLDRCPPGGVAGSRR